MATKIGSLIGDISINTKRLDRDIRQAQRKLRAFGRSATQTGKQLAIGIGTPMAIIGGGAIKTFQNFEQEMAKVKAISGATAKEFKALGDNARELGATTRFTASNVAELQLNFSKLGFSASEIQKVTSATLDLALATGEDLGESARVAAQVLRGFNMDASEMGRVVDVMANSFSATALDLSKFDTAMSIVSATATVSGASIEETSAMIGVLTNRGIDASSAGTGLRNMFLKLSKEGLTFSEALDRINNSVDPATTAMDLFGVRGATVGVTLAMNQEELRGLAKEFNNADGTARKLAEIMDDTVQGSLFKLKSAFEGVQLELAQKLVPKFRQFVDQLSEFMSRNKEAVADLLKLGMKVGSLAMGFGALLFIVGQTSFLIANLATAIGVMGRLFNTAILPITAMTAGLKAFNAQVLLGKLIAFGKAMGIVVGVMLVIKGLFEGLTGKKFSFGEMIVNVLAGVVTILQTIFDKLKSIINFVGEAISKLMPEMDESAPRQRLVQLGITPSRKESQRLHHAKGEDKEKVFQDILAKRGFSTEVDAQKAKFKKDNESPFAKNKAFIESLLSGDMTSVLQSFNVQLNSAVDGLEDMKLDPELEEQIKKNDKALQGLLEKLKPGEFQKFATSMKDGFKLAMDNIKNDTKVTAEEMTNVMKMATDGMTNSLMEFMNTGKMNFKNFVGEILRELQRLTIQKQVVNPLFSLLQAGGNALLGYLNPTAGVQAPTLKDTLNTYQGTGTDFGGFAATGGNIRGGKSYIVGERGPELFTPRVSGFVTPNHAMAGGQSAVINFNITAADAQSFDQQMMQRKNMIVGMVNEAFNQQGKGGIYG